MSSYCHDAWCAVCTSIGSGVRCSTREETHFCDSRCKKIYTKFNTEREKTQVVEPAVKTVITSVAKNITVIIKQGINPCIIQDL